MIDDIYFSTAASTFVDMSRNFPSQDSISAKTENITKKIQELLLSARENKHERLVDYAVCVPDVGFILMAKHLAL